MRVAYYSSEWQTRFRIFVDRGRQLYRKLQRIDCNHRAILSSSMIATHLKTVSGIVIMIRHSHNDHISFGYIGWFNIFTYFCIILAREPFTEKRKQDNANLNIFVKKNLNTPRFMDITTEIQSIVNYSYSYTLLCV